MEPALAVCREDVRRRAQTAVPVGVKAVARILVPHEDLRARDRRAIRIDHLAQDAAAPALDDETYPDDSGVLLGIEVAQVKERRWLVEACAGTHVAFPGAGSDPERAVQYRVRHLRAE